MSGVEPGISKYSTFHDGEMMRGFAKMSRDVVKALARKGGKKAQASGRGHQFTTEEARAAGRKGGKRHSAEHMRDLGRRGGLAKAAKGAARVTKTTPATV